MIGIDFSSYFLQAFNILDLGWKQQTTNQLLKPGFQYFKTPQDLISNYVSYSWFLFIYKPIQQFN